MSTKLIPAHRWRDALEFLLRGQVVGMPTDTVYGIAAMPLDDGAIDAVYAAKDRPADKALPMLVAGIDDAARIAELTASVRRLCAACWPGALTIVATTLPSFTSVAVADDGTVALRMPDLDLARRLIAAAGGVLAVTSANRSGQSPATTASEVLEQLDGRIAAVIDGGPSPGGVPSSVIRVDAGQVVILREGAIPRSEIERALQPTA
jgi:L-threonylcarbamoyladenylate synthase